MKSQWRWNAMLAASLLGVSATACAPDDPFDFGGPRSCDVGDHNEWIFGVMQHAYLWADDMPTLDPRAYDTPSAMIVDLRVGHDRWSRISDLARSEALFEEGKVVSLGFRTRRDIDDRVVVSTVDAGSPAALAGMRRGDVVREIGGLTTEQIDQEERWGDIYGDTEPGVTVAFELEAIDGEVRELSLVKDWIALDTVPVAKVLEVAGRPVGYVMLSTFVDTSIDALDTAFAELRRAGVREVVVDLRYNGGGLVLVARHFMHLLVGAIAEGEVAYRVRYNDEFADENEDRFLTRLDQSLPAVDHVVFITTGSTLSASELLINSVASHVKVSIVGDTTGGKPVGSRHFDACDQRVAPITFQLSNAERYGDYFDGLSPTCAAPDDLTQPLGDAAEGSLATALHLMSTGECLELAEAPGAHAGEPIGLRTPPEPATHELEPWPELAGLR